MKFKMNIHRIEHDAVTREPYLVLILVAGLLLNSKLLRVKYMNSDNSATLESSKLNWLFVLLFSQVREVVSNRYNKMLTLLLLRVFRHYLPI